MASSIDPTKQARVVSGGSTPTHVIKPTGLGMSPRSSLEPAPQPLSLPPSTPFAFTQLPPPSSSSSSSSFGRIPDVAVIVPSSLSSRPPPKSWVAPPLPKRGPERAYRPIRAQNGVASADHVFVCTSHLDQSDTQKIYSQVPLRGNAVYGCGVFSVFNFASSKDGITHVGAFDINPNVGLFTSDIVNILSEDGLTLSRAREKIFAYLEHDPNARWQLAEEIRTNLSFLSNEERFARMRKFLPGFSFTMMNFLNPKAVKTFLAEQTAKGAVFDLFYISNIPDFVCTASLYSKFIKGKDDFAQYLGLEDSLALLPPHAIVIDARKKEATDEFRSQRIHLKDKKKLLPPPCSHAYFQALMKDDYDAVTLCLKNGAKGAPSDEGFTILMAAIEAQKNNSVRALLDSRANVHETDTLKRNALHIAAAVNNWKGIELLVGVKGDIHARDSRKMTPLHWAAYKGHLLATVTLLKLGADRSALDESNNTPLGLTRRKDSKAYVLRTSNPITYRSLQKALTLGNHKKRSSSCASSSSSSSSSSSTPAPKPSSDRKAKNK